MQPHGGGLYGPLLDMLPLLFGLLVAGLVVKNMTRRSRSGRRRPRRSPGLLDALVREMVGTRRHERSIDRDYLRHKGRLYGEQDGHCNGCGRHFDERNLEVDHIHPVAKGGGDDIGNLQLLCHTCNREKGVGTQGELMRRLRRSGVIKGSKARR